MQNSIQVTNVHIAAIANFIKNIKHIDISDANGYFNEIEDAVSTAKTEVQAMSDTDLSAAITTHACNYQLEDYDTVSDYIAGTACNIILARIPNPYLYGGTWGLTVSK